MPRPAEGRRNRAEGNGMWNLHASFVCSASFPLRDQNSPGPMSPDKVVNHYNTDLSLTTGL